MKWLDQSVRIDAPTAAIIAHDLRRVAEIDGHLHERELSLIEAFERELPSEEVPQDAVLETDEIRMAYLRSLIMLALADGEIADEEHELILKLAEQRGISNKEVEDATANIKKEFFSIFAGVKLFRQSLMGLAEGMGMSASEVDEMWD